MTKKRMIVIGICILIFSMLTACGEEGEEIEEELPTISYFSEDYAVSYKKYEEPDMSWIANADFEKLDNKFQNSVNEICKDICKDICAYLNTEFDAYWHANPIKVYSVKVTKNLRSSLKYGACYYRYKIYMDRSLITKKLNVRTKYILAHVLIHYLFEINAKELEGDIFALQKKEKYSGIYLEEAFVDSLARKYCLYKNPDVDVSKFSSDYKNIRLYIDLLAFPIPDIYHYFFTNDIKGLQKVFNEHAEKHVACVDNVFEKWTSVLDATMSDSKGIVEKKFSTMISFYSVITHYKDSFEFVRRTKKDGLNLRKYVNYMY